MGETVIGRPGSPYWFATASSATQHNYFNQKCTDYGYKVGTDAHAQCMQTETGNARRSADARSAGMSAGLASAGQIVASQPPPPQPPPIPQRVNCTSRPNGYGSVITTCW